MKQSNAKTIMAMIAMCSATAVAHAQQPPDVVESDSLGNTAMGTNAMFSNNGGDDNTAAGNDALSLNTNGSNNAAFGYGALNRNTSGNRNAALGDDALSFNSTGSNNSAFGTAALDSNTTGGKNSAVGDSALYFNTTGTQNTASGQAALYFNTTGNDNSAFGYSSLGNNTSGNSNAAFGAGALYSNTMGYANNANGFDALFANSIGYDNNAVGYYALYANTTGYNNNAQGSNALASNTTGYGNSGMGANSLLNVTTGSRNVGVGNNTGTALVAGNYNVDIGWGVSGAGDESGVVRIGNPGYASATYVAGIGGATVTGAAVYVTASGQLGVLASSARYKSDISSLSAETARLERLRPVSFHLKSEPGGALQYGLIAEEVDQIYPELVIRDERGQIQGVRYDELAPILLSEVKQQRQELREARALIAAQDAKYNALEQQVTEVQAMNRAMQAALLRLQDGDIRVTMR